MSTLAERMKLALDASGRTRKQLGDYCGVKHPAVTFWLNGHTKTLSANNALKAAAFLGVSPGWLANGVGDMHDGENDLPSLVEREEREADICEIPVYSAAFSAGHGRIPCFDDLISDSVEPYYRTWFQEKGVNPDRCKCFSVSGESMHPFIWDKDRITVDCSQSEIILSGRVYAFTIDGEMRVKRLFKQVDGSILIRSDNPAFPEEILPPSERERLVLIGRVIDRHGSHNL